MLWGVYLGGVGGDGEDGIGTGGERGGDEGCGEEELVVHDGGRLGDDLKSTEEMGE